MSVCVLLSTVESSLNQNPPSLSSTYIPTELKGGTAFFFFSWRNEFKSLWFM